MAYLGKQAKHDSAGDYRAGSLFPTRARVRAELRLGRTDLTFYLASKVVGKTLFFSP